MIRLRPYAQLVRLPNVFTAISDIAIGGMIMVRWSQGPLSSRQIAALAFLMFTSAALYCSGMAWNDYFDLEQDERERPYRPLPSRRISMTQAFRLAFWLMALGLGLAILADRLNPDVNASVAAVAVILAGTIFLYDWRLKRTWLGPLALGACRFLNVILGFCLVPPFMFDSSWPTASIVGAYTAGVTWFARTEAQESRTNDLMLAALVSAAAIVVAVLLPAGLPVGSSSVLYPFLLVAFVFWLERPALAAIRLCRPAEVQRAVRRAVLGIILFDAILASGFVGTSGLLIAFLIVPAAVLGQRLYST